MNRSDKAKQQSLKKPQSHSPDYYTIVGFGEQQNESELDSEVLKYLLDTLDKDLISDDDERRQNHPPSISHEDSSDQKVSSDPISNPSGVQSCMNQEFIQALLKYPNMTPARLTLIMNYRNESPQETSEHASYQKKKRTRKPVSQEVRQKRNFRRRFFNRYRSIGGDFVHNFITMVTNVINACDIDLLKSFIEKYYDPNFVYIKLLKNSEYSSKKYCSYGLDNYHQIVSLVLQASPDLIHFVDTMKFKYNRKTKQTVIITKSKQCGTRTKILSSLFVQIMNQLQLLAKKYLSFQQNKSPQAPTKLTSEPNLETTNDCIYINNLEKDLIDYDFDFDIDSIDEISDEIHSEIPEDMQIFDSNEVTQMVNPFIPQLSTSNTQISVSISKLFQNVNIYSMFQQLIYQPKDTFTSIISWFPSGLKTEVDYTSYYYINEHQRVVQLDVFIENIKIEISNGDYFRPI